MRPALVTRSGLRLLSDCYWTAYGAVWRHRFCRHSQAFSSAHRCGRRSVIVLIFRQLFDQQSSTYTYLLADSATGEAVLIDPVFEQVRRDTALIDELRLHLLYTIDTHIHADHVTGA